MFFFCAYVGVQAQDKLLDSTMLAKEKEYTNLADALKVPLKVYRLNLSSQNLASLPKEIGELKNLQIFYCSDNQLTSLPKEIGELKNLQVLYCNLNQLNLQEKLNIKKLLPNCKIYLVLLRFIRTSF